MQGVITQKQEATTLRVETHEGRKHLVAPVVAIVEGVMNDALVTQAEFGRFVQAWNGIPVPVLHPQKNGKHVSANSPDVIERTIGRFYNAKVVDNKLMGEIWLDIEKTNGLGYGEIVNSMNRGEMFEVSTGYFSDDEPRSGDFEGQSYGTIHRNIRPDHLAILVGQEGACSIGDGCGVPRINEGAFQKAFATFCKTIGLQPNTQGDDDMQLSKEHVTLATILAVQCKGVQFKSVDQVVAEAEKIKANEGITPKQLQMLMDMDTGGRELMLAFLQALQQVGEPAKEEPPEEPVVPATEDEERMLAQAKKAGFVTKGDIAELVANGIAEGTRRVAVTELLTANESCPFDADELKTMSVDHLEKLEKSLRPADYTGMGGFNATSHGDKASEVEPMKLHQGVLAKETKAKDGKAA